MAACESKEVVQRQNEEEESESARTLSSESYGEPSPRKCLGGDLVPVK
jgi:hypothetical protein